jgi:hypothetical protein
MPNATSIVHRVPNAKAAIAISAEVQRQLERAPAGATPPVQPTTPATAIWSQPRRARRSHDPTTVATKAARTPKKIHAMTVVTVEALEAPVFYLASRTDLHLIHLTGPLLPGTGTTEPYGITVRRP